MSDIEKIGQIRLTFGRNKGSKLKDVYGYDQSYLKWIIAPSTNFSDKNFVRNVRRYLEAMGDIAPQEEPFGGAAPTFSPTVSWTNTASSSSTDHANFFKKTQPTTQSPFKSTTSTNFSNLFNTTQPPPQPQSQPKQQSFDQTLEKLRQDMNKTIKENTQLQAAFFRKDAQLQKATKKIKSLQEELQAQKVPDHQQKLVKENQALRKIIQELMPFRKYYLRQKTEHERLEENQESLTELLENINLGDRKGGKEDQQRSEDSGL